MICSVGANGEPFVDFSGSSTSEAFSYFEHLVTGEGRYCQQRQLTSEEREEMQERDRQYLRSLDIRINMSKRVFQFIPTECCSDIEKRWGHDRKFSVLVPKKQHGHTYWDYRHIRTCQCTQCTSYKGVDVFRATGRFLYEVGRVRIEV